MNQYDFEPPTDETRARTNYITCGTTLVAAMAIVLITAILNLFKVTV